MHCTPCSAHNVHTSDEFEIMPGVSGFIVLLDFSCSACHAQNASAAAEVLKLALVDPDVLAAAKTLVTAVQIAAVSNPLNGYSVAALAANPSVRAALVPLVAAAAAASGVEWAAVDTTEVLATVSALPCWQGDIGCSADLAEISIYFQEG